MVIVSFYLGDAHRSKYVSRSDAERKRSRVRGKDFLMLLRWKGNRYLKRKGVVVKRIDWKTRKIKPVYIVFSGLQIVSSLMGFAGFSKVPILELVILSKSTL